MLFDISWYVWRSKHMWYSWNIWHSQCRHKLFLYKQSSSLVVMFFHHLCSSHGDKMKWGTFLLRHSTQMGSCHLCMTCHISLHAILLSRRPQNPFKHVFVTLQVKVDACILGAALKASTRNVMLPYSKSQMKIDPNWYLTLWINLIDEQKFKHIIMVTRPLFESNDNKLYIVHVRWNGIRPEYVSHIGVTKLLGWKLHFIAHTNHLGNNKVIKRQHPSTEPYQRHTLSTTHSSMIDP